MTAHSSPKRPRLKRSIGLFLLTMYGLGTILGAGIYVLIGEVAGVAGMGAPMSFVLACVVAGFTALSYGELAARLPKSAGEAAYVDAAFKRSGLSKCIGWAVVMVGVVSAATLCRGLVGYAGVFVSWPAEWIIVITVTTLCGLALWGIQEALWAAAFVTMIEIAGLLFVCFVAADELLTLPSRFTELLPANNTAAWSAVAGGAFVAFYAFIGFEDIVNVAEEVKDPQRTVPLAIMLSLGIATTLYFIVSVAGVFSLPPESLAATDAPLAAIVSAAGYSTALIAGISLLAVINGGLVQLIMASRVLYGMASQGLAWQAFAAVNKQTQTPILATICAAAVVLGLSMFLSLGGLARLTSAIALGLFAVINAALIQLKRSPTDVSFRIPIFIPVLGLLSSLVMLSQQILSMG